MSVIYFLISISIVVAVLFLYAFIKAVRSGQYDDDYTPSVRMLFDDELVKKKTNKNQINITEEKQL
jgi:cbb3-type cytochrome oxidase maturation protein